MDTDDLFGYLRGDTWQYQVESNDSCSHFQSKASLRRGGGTDDGVILHVLRLGFDGQTLLYFFFFFFFFFFERERESLDVFDSITANFTGSPMEWRDLILNDLKARNEIVNFVQIGACDGDWKKTNDPLQSSLMTSPHFHGLMVEPVPELFEKLQAAIQEDEEMKDRIDPIHAAISPDQDGSATFYMVKVEEAEAEIFTAALESWPRIQLGSFDEADIAKNLRDHPGLQKKGWKHYVREITVKALTPSTLMDQYFGAGKDLKVHILMIDAEENDGKIFKAFMDVPGMRPNIVVFMNTHLAKKELDEYVKILKEIGYLVHVPSWGNGDIVAVKVEVNLNF